MADEKNAQQDAAAEPAKKKFPVKAIVLILALLLIEAGAFTAVMILGGGPDKVQAESGAVDLEADLETLVEMPLLQDKFQNRRTGRAFLYDTTINILVKKKNQTKVSELLEENTARIESDISSIFTKAEPAYLEEHQLSTIRRQVKAALNTRVGLDEDDNPRIEEVIMRTKRFKAD